jgi:hypothetical protein
MGKSTVARSAVVGARDPIVVDFRGLDVGDTRVRLSTLLGLVPDSRIGAVILDDLNEIDHPSCRAALLNLLSALRRRDKPCIITCYRTPSNKTLVDLGLDQAAVSEVSAFSEEEVSEVVESAGGDPEKWGLLTYLAAGIGHPQLVNAFVSSMRVQGWPLGVVATLAKSGLISDDVAAERDSARRTLIQALPEGARVLLGRLSLFIGRFDRELALAIGNIAPKIERTSECLDELIGPWVEAVADEFRVSPLAGDLGSKTLTAAEQKSIHYRIADSLAALRSITPSQANSILAHGLLGKNSTALVRIAMQTILLSEADRRVLRDELLLQRSFATDRLIYDDDLYLSILLRLAQFELISSDSESDLTAVSTALLSELDRLEGDGKHIETLQTLAISKLLATIGIAQYLPGWVSLLDRYSNMLSDDETLKGLAESVAAKSESRGATVPAMLFSVGSATIERTSSLLRIFRDLDKIDAIRRQEFLSSHEKLGGDYSVLVNMPWVHSGKRDEFEWSAAEREYLEMESLARGWGMPNLAVRCRVARAVLLDEFAGDSSRALAILDEAIGEYGGKIPIARAKAHVFFRRSDHELALPLLAESIPGLSESDHVERAFACREAAISAAQLDQWESSLKFFLLARDSAERLSSPDMRAMAIGFWGDAAVARLMCGDQRGCLDDLATSLRMIETVDQSETLQAAYCHRVLRHTVLWATSKVSGDDASIDGEPLLLLAGTCSNPEPPEAIRDRPLGLINMAWYMLATAEIDADLTAVIGEELRSRLGQNPIPMMEVSLREARLATTIRENDDEGFVRFLPPYLDATAYLVSVDREKFNALSPEIGEVPLIDLSNPPPLVITAFDSALTAFAAVCLLDRAISPFTSVLSSIQSKFPALARDSAFFAEFSSQTFSEQLDGEVRRRLFRLLDGSALSLAPRDSWGLALRVLEWSAFSRFKREILSSLAQWVQIVWSRLIEEQRFLLVAPSLNVPKIEAALLATENDDELVTGVVLASIEGLKINISDAYRRTIAMIPGSSRKVRMADYVAAATRTSRTAP